MANANLNPSIGDDGSTAADKGTLVAGKDGAGAQQDIRTDTDGHLQIDVLSSVIAGSAVDSNNSTTTPLTGSAVYTGTGTDLLGYSTVCTTLYADVDSATDGMTFQFSTDNSNWDDVYTFTMNVSSSDTRRFQFPITARYFRIVYTNGSGAQSAFRVQTILHTANQLTSIHRIVDDASPDRSAQIMKSAIIAQAAGSGDFVPVQATAGGNFKVSVEEYDSGAFSSDMEGGGKISVGTTAVEATFTGTTRSITITADPSNTANLYVGESNVTNTGANAFTILVPGESVEIDYQDGTNAVYVVGASASQNFWKGALLV